MKDPEIEDISQNQLQSPMDVHMHSCVPLMCKHVYTHACLRHTPKGNGKRNVTGRDLGESEVRLKELKGLVMLKFRLRRHAQLNLFSLLFDKHFLQSIGVGDTVVHKAEL